MQREVKWLALGYLACKWCSQDTQSSNLIVPEYLITIFYRLTPFVGIQTEISKWRGREKILEEINFKYKTRKKLKIN